MSAILRDIHKEEGKLNIDNSNTINVYTTRRLPSHLIDDLLIQISVNKVYNNIDTIVVYGKG